MLGAPRFLDEEMEERTKEPGVAIGLAWTPAGGEVLFIEASRMAGHRLADADRSARRRDEGVGARGAVVAARARRASTAIDPDFFKNAEMHVHVPSGAIPKDGPSAGVTMATALASELTGRPVRGDVAMTGEITLSGRVLPVGGIKEKVLAARRVGIHEVILPRQNEKNVNEDLTPELRQDLTIHLVSTIDEVLVLALQPVSSDVRPLKSGADGAEGARSRRAAIAARPESAGSMRVVLLGPVSHRYRAARFSHRKVPAGLTPSPRDGRDPAVRRHRAGAGDLGRARARSHARSISTSCATARCRPTTSRSSSCRGRRRWSRASG